MRNFKILIFICFILLVGYVYAESSSCIKCHTDENAMKKLVKAPKIESGEGEG